VVTKNKTHLEGLPPARQARRNFLTMQSDIVGYWLQIISSQTEAVDNLVIS
jgi:hypothetical protein